VTEAATAEPLHEASSACEAAMPIPTTKSNMPTRRRWRSDILVFLRMMMTTCG
jgi:hypothetical protein